MLSSSLLARSKNERRPSVKDQHTILFRSDRRLKPGWLFAAVSAFLRAPFRYRIAWEVQFLLWKGKRKFCSSAGWSGLNMTKEKYRLTCGAVQHWETSDSKSSVTSRDIVELCNRTRGGKCFSEKYTFNYSHPAHIYFSVFRCKLTVNKF